MERWLNIHIGHGVADGVSRRQLFRLAASSRLVSDVDRRMQHHHGRKETSHIYDHEKAERVYWATMDFMHDARQLLKALEARND